MSGNSFCFHTSNKLESFLDEVSKAVRELSAEAPFSPKQIVVQTPGIGRWLALKMAERNSIIANIEFVPPEDFLNNFADKYLGIEYKKENYDKKKAEWKIYSFFGTKEFSDDANSIFSAAWNYINGSESRRFQLARKTADLFEQYFVYHPHMIKAWMEGKTYKNSRDEEWQRRIFSSLQQKKETVIFSDRFCKECEKAKRTEDMPQFLILFAISIMNRSQLEMFKALSRLFPVHIFSMLPTEFGFMNPNKDTFLGRLCSAGMEMMDFIGNSDTVSTGEKTSGETLLASIQNDIFEDTSAQDESTANSTSNPSCCNNTIIPFEKSDGSLKICACWNKMREMEVLKDYLLSIFEQDKTLKPDDVVVMAPRTDDYVPYITAVFGNRNEIPWSITDRKFSNESKIAATFIEMLELPKSRFEKSRILSIFRSPYVMKKFGSSDDQFNSIKELVEKSGIKWGFDKESRSLCLGNADRIEVSEQNTWDFGLSRIMLSHMIPFTEECLSFEGILPIEGFESSEATVYAPFITFFRELSSFVEMLKTSHTPMEWRSVLDSALSSFFLKDKDSYSEIKHIKNILQQFSEKTLDIGEEQISFDAISEYMESELSREKTGSGILSEKVTFCSLKPLRALPFRVICLIGMDEKSFPREEKKFAFDLIQQIHEPDEEPKERSIRENDRYLFLESVVSAREKLYISYSGNNLSSGSTDRIYAADPVKWLEELIQEKFDKFKQEEMTCEEIQKKEKAENTEGKDKEKEKEIEIKTPLHPFSEKYFSCETTDPEFSTFSEKNYRIAYALAEAERNTENSRLQSAEEERAPESSETMQISIDDLTAFFKDPAKYYFTKTANVKLPDIKDETDDEELFDYSNGLVKYHAALTFFKMNDTDRFKERMKGEGSVPLGIPGEKILDDLTDQWKQISDKLTGDKLEPVNISVNLEILGKQFEITEKCCDLYRDEETMQTKMKIAVTSSISEKYSKYVFEALIRHLALNACGIPAVTEIWYRKKDSKKKISELKHFEFRSVSKEKAEEYLKHFVWLFDHAKNEMPLYDPSIMEAISKTINHKDKKGAEPKIPKEADFINAVKQQAGNNLNNSYTSEYFKFAVKQCGSPEDYAKAMISSHSFDTIKEITGIINEFIK